MILAILQARFSSSRLPGKVLKMILQKEMLLHQIERIQLSRKIDKLIVATSLEASDDLIEGMCLKNDILCYRGSLTNVLDRFFQCASKYDPQHIVRLTGDCPLVDYRILDDVIEHHLKGGFDYTTNAFIATYPDGLDVEVMTYKTLSKVWQNATLPSEKEHVTLFINQHYQDFLIGHYVYCRDISYLRWTVDEPEDFNFVVQVYQKLYPINQQFLMDDILELLEREPHLKNINCTFLRNEGLKQSFIQDKEFLEDDI